MFSSFFLLLWFNLCRQLNTMQPFIHSLTSGIGEKIQRIKMIKFEGWDRDNLKQVKQMQCMQEKQKKGINSPLPMGMWSAFSWKARLHKMQSLLGVDKRHQSRCSPFFLPLVLYTEHDIIWYGISPGQLQWAALTVCLPNSLYAPSLLSGGAERAAAKSFVLCKHCSTIMKISPHYQPCFQSKSKTQSHTKQCAYKIQEECRILPWLSMAAPCGRFRTKAGEWWKSYCLSMVGKPISNTENMIQHFLWRNEPEMCMTLTDRL